MFRILLCLALVSVTGSVRAAAPDVKSLFPAGGQRGTTVSVRLGGTVGTAPVAVWCSRSDLKIEPSKEAGHFDVAIPAEAAPGRCWIRWSNAEGASGVRPFVIGSLAELAETEPNNELSKATQLPSARMVANGILEKSGDVDVFAVTLKKGETLVAWLDAHTLLGSPMDASVQILTPQGFVVAQNDDDHGLDPFAVYTAAVDGAHFVRLFAFPSEPNSSVSFFGSPESIYRLTVTTGPFADFALPRALVRNAPAPVQLSGWNLPGERAVQPALLPGEADLAWIGAPHVDNLLTVPVVDHPALVESRTGTEPQALVPPVSVSGVIERRREKDAYRITAKKGQRWTVTLGARSFGSPLDPAVRVTDSTGKVLQDVDDAPRTGPDAEFVFAPPADGEYRLEVRDLYDDGGPRYVYHLSLTDVNPDVSLTIGADRFTLPTDKPVEIPVTIERTNGFAEELELSVTGLPAGLKVVPGKSEAKGDSAKLAKLTIEREPGEAAAGLPAGVPFRIVAKSTGPLKVERTAEFVLTAPKVRVADAWLTVSPAAKK